MHISLPKVEEREILMLMLRLQRLITYHFKQEVP